MNISRTELINIAYDVLRQAQNRKEYPPVIIGQLSTKETWIVDEIIRKCEDVSSKKMNTSISNCF